VREDRLLLGARPRRLLQSFAHRIVSGATGAAGASCNKRNDERGQGQRRDAAPEQRCERGQATDSSARRFRTRVRDPVVGRKHRAAREAQAGAIARRLVDGTGRAARELDDASSSIGTTSPGSETFAVTVDPRREPVQLVARRNPSRSSSRASSAS
jgi:hypothetical protein